MKVIGVVGGIGSGKSTVVSLITQLANSYVINADYIGHNILKQGNLGYLPVLKTFGSEILNEDGEINRKLLGKIVFTNPQELIKLNNISHPLIYQEVQDQIKLISKTKQYEYIIVDAALLIEIKLIQLVDEVWGVYAPLEVQIERIIHRDGLTKEEATDRINSQLSWDRLKDFADIEIDNSRGVQYTKKQITSILDRVKRGLND